ncbi:MAG: hypothetical protein OEU93_17960, partial [Rubrivivax sp.]|nr:hypothetical protein [Rubrivivax sp.]
SYTSGSANIARVLFSVQQSQPGPSVYGYFDNLSFATTVGSGLVRYDDFNSKRWVETFIGTGITTFTKSSKMNMVVAANAAGDPFVGRLDSLCLLRGDFDLSVEYNFPAFQQGSGVRTGLVVPGAGHIERTSGSSHDVGLGGEIYYGAIGGTSLEAVPTGDITGKLRLARVGSAMSAYYSGGKSTAWKLLGTGKVALDDLPFQLQVWSHDPFFDDRKVTVQFDNVTLNSGKLVGPSCPTPTP